MATFALSSSVVHYKYYRTRINQGSLLRWNKMNAQQQDQHCSNAGTKEIQQLNPGGLDQRQIIKPHSTSLNVLGRSHH